MEHNYVSNETMFWLVVIWGLAWIYCLGHQNINYFIKHIFSPKIETISGVAVNFTENHSYQSVSIDADEFGTSICDEPVLITEHYVFIKDNNKVNKVQIPSSVYWELKQHPKLRNKKIVFYFKEYFFMGPFFYDYEIEMDPT